LSKSYDIGYFNLTIVILIIPWEVEQALTRTEKAIHLPRRKDMPRERATDYDLKVKVIKDAAADLFARIGYTGTKMVDIAKTCNASKSMLYHYFPTKDDILFDMMSEHIKDVIAALEEATLLDQPGPSRFTAFLRNFIQRSSQSRQRNMVAMNDVKYLPKAMQTKIFKLESQVIELVVAQLHVLNPNLAPNLYKPYALLLIGMLNWTDTWYSQRGALKPDELVNRISRLFLKGFLNEKE
jgi:AcrR family transcriptional regulator